MEKDWDLRARTHARFYIECAHHRTEEEFDQSGERDLEAFVLRDLQLARDAVVLEIGCGMGRLLKPLASRTSAVHGVDVSGEMIARARDRLSGYPNIHVQKTSGADLAPLPESYFDFCFSFITFQHIPLKRVVCHYFEEVSRVLKPGGVFRFQVDGRGFDASRRDNAGTWDGVVFDSEEICDQLSRSGFETTDLWGQDTQYFLITAVKAGKPGVPSTTRVRSFSRVWNEASVQALTKSLCPDSSDRSATALLHGSISPRRLADQFIERRRHLPAEQYVTAAYEVFLNRLPDDEGLVACLAALRTGTLTMEGVVENVIASQEFHELLRRQADSWRTTKVAVDAGEETPQGATPANTVQGAASGLPVEVVTASVPPRRAMARLRRLLLGDLRQIIEDSVAFFKCVVTRDRVEIGFGQFSAESPVAVHAHQNRYLVTIGSTAREARDVRLTIDIYALESASQPGGHYAYFSKRLRVRPRRSTRVEIQYDWHTAADFLVDGTSSPPDDLWRGTLNWPARHSVSAVLLDPSGNRLERLTVYQELAP